MKKIKITTIILAIILITLVAFGGIYIQKQNRMENKVKGYILGRELKGARVVEIKISEGDSEGNNKPKKEDLTIENYETVKRTIEKRLENLRAQDYTISLNKENGTIRIELLEDDNTDNYIYYAIASGKVQIKDKDSKAELINDTMIKKAKYTSTNNTQGAYQVYVELELNKEGQAKLQEISQSYALLGDEKVKIEKAILTSDIGINPNNDGKVIRLAFPELNEERRKELVKNIKKMAEDAKVAIRAIRRDGIDEFKKQQKDEKEEEKSEEKQTKKVSVLTIGETEYDIYKIEKNKIIVKIGSETSNNTSINTNMSKAAEIAMLINSGKYPLTYEIENNRYTYSDISEKEILYFSLIILAIILVISIIFIIKYKIKGLLGCISNIGFIALFSLLLRYTNVLISIEGIGAIVVIIAINLKVIQTLLRKIEQEDIINKTIVNTYKKMSLKLIPIVIISLTFCFSGWTNLSSFGMVMFWGLILMAVYNILVTKTLLKLKENK